MRIWIDRGGTFTDCIAQLPDGTLRIKKLLSEGLPEGRDAALEGVRQLLDEVPAPSAGAPLDLRRAGVSEIRLGTTVATNALLTRSGARTLLVITAGFEDLLWIGDQARPELFALEIRKPEPLVERVHGLEARCAAEGTVLAEPDWAALREVLREARGDGFEALAVSLMHADRNPAHELRVKRLAEDVGFTYVALGHEVSPLPHFLARTETAVADAYLGPVVRRYVEQFRAGLGLQQQDEREAQDHRGEQGDDTDATAASIRVRFMQSSGGLVDGRAFRGKDAVLSGPAGGVVGLAHVAKLAGEARVIGWDMGGTSTDVSHHVDLTQCDAADADADGDADHGSMSDGFERVDELHVANTRLRTPALRVETVAAGGGSILKFQHGRLVVGPESAGAHPGPACYGFGGPLTVTDANLLLGRIQPDFFPRVFGPQRNEPLNVAVVQERFAELAARINREAGGESYTPQQLALGFLRVANETMSKPIRVLSTAQGRDIRRYTLVPFGGAGAQHACDVARLLGMRRIVLHPLAGLLSAWGIGCAPVQRLHQVALDLEFDGSNEAATRLNEHIAAALQASVSQRKRFIHEEGLEASQVQTKVAVQLRYRGSEQRFTLPLNEPARLPEQLATAHKQRFGFVPESRDIYVDALQQTFVGQTAAPAATVGSVPDHGQAQAEEEQVRAGTDEAQAAVHEQSELSSMLFPVEKGVPVPQMLREIYLESGEHIAPVYLRMLLQPGDTLHGPALVVEAHSTTLVAPGFTLTVDARGLLLLEDVGDASLAPATKLRAEFDANTDEVTLTVHAPPPATEIRAESEPDPVLLEVFHQRFMGIAEQMGAALQKTARSVNIKERLDFSCALFDAHGGLVANAPHIPVHLGAMGETVATVAANTATTSWLPGDALATNDPAEGGSHLPDITVISPVFASDLQVEQQHGASKSESVDNDENSNDDSSNHNTPLFFVACRGHHADVGGTTPGSMPPFSRRLDEEGVVLRSFLLARNGRFHEDALRQHLAAGPYPARSPDDNVADLQAQLAANATGRAALAQLVREFGLDTVRRYMGHVQANAAAAVREALASTLADTHDATFADTLDDGTPIQVRIRPGAEKTTLDFHGTGEQLPEGNLNAPRAVTVAAVLYVMRALIQQPIPLNSGCLEPLELLIPAGSVIAPEAGLAVVGGNVETSQRIVDVLLGALGVAAASQGTMNNLTFGNERYQHYETICGGAGATPRHAGAHAVHTHMTNTHITDPEVLERRFPVRLIRFALRRGSGAPAGPGAHAGGDGAVREFEFLEAMQVSMLAQRRIRAPFGLHGGKPGTPGRTWHILAEPHEAPRLLPGQFHLTVQPGERIRVETPGGGAYGTNSGYTPKPTDFVGG